MGLERGGCTQPNPQVAPGTAARPTTCRQRWTATADGRNDGPIIRMGDVVLVKVEAHIHSRQSRSAKLFKGTAGSRRSRSWRLAFGRSPKSRQRLLSMDYRDWCGPGHGRRVLVREVTIQPCDSRVVVRLARPSSHWSTPRPSNPSAMTAATLFSGCSHHLPDQGRNPLEAPELQRQLRSVDS